MAKMNCRAWPNFKLQWLSDSNLDEQLETLRNNIVDSMRQQLNIDMPASSTDQHRTDMSMMPEHAADGNNIAKRIQFWDGLEITNNRSDWVETESM